MKKGTFEIEGAESRKIAADYRFEAVKEKRPAILFLHGFKGFKDWGHFNLMADAFAGEGFVVVKFNFSHNGTTPENPCDFVDLEAFGRNTFYKEIADVQAVLNVMYRRSDEFGIDTGRINLLGHSRGGGTAVLTAARDERIAKLATLASIADLEKRFTDEQFSQWNTEGVIAIPNSRTGKEMPLYRDLIDEYSAHRRELDFVLNALKLDIPHLIIHGTNDKTVGIDEAEMLYRAGKHTRLKFIEGAGHTFGGKHPFEETELPEYTRKAVELVSRFFREKE